MQKHKVKGTLLQIGAIETMGSGFTLRKLIVDVTDNPNYKSPVEFRLKKDHVGDIEGYKPGERIELEFTLDGRQWDGPNGTRFFTDLSVWHVNRLAVTTAAPAATNAANPAPAKGATIQDAVAAWNVNHSGDKNGFSELCKGIFPGKSSKAYTSDDWGVVIAKITQIDLGTPEPQGDQFTDDIGW